MTADAMIAAGQALADAMMAETAALDVPGFPGIAAHTDAKLAALENFERLFVAPLPDDPRLPPLLEELRELADINRDALASAIAMQDAVLAAVRDALLQSDPNPGPRALSLDA